MNSPERAASLERPLRIVFVLNALVTGGAELHTTSLARALVDRGHSCLLVPLLKENQVSSCGLDSYSIGSNSLLDLSATRRLGDCFSKYLPDIVVAVNGRPSAFTQLALLNVRLRKPVVTVYHTTLLHNIRQKLQHTIHLPFINRSDALVFVSANQRAYCTKHFMRGQRAETILNGVDGKRFYPAAVMPHRTEMRERLGFGADEYVIGQSAVFRPEKNHVQSLQALAVLRARGLPVRLLFVGDGPQRQQIEALARGLNVSNQLVLAGRQADVLPWLAACDVGILTSTAIETFSLAALEFMALGIPVVLSDVGGANEMVVDGDNGRIFPVDDTLSFVAALEELADRDCRARMGEAAAARVAKYFTLEKMVSHYEVLFQQMAVQC